MALRNGLIAGLAAALLLATACSRPAVKAYPGPLLPASQTALIGSGAYTRIVGLDGQGVTSQELAVLPGPHTVRMRIVEAQQPKFTEYWFYSSTDGLVDFVAEPGHRYLVSIDFVASPSPVSGENDSGFRWVGYVSDRATDRTVARTDYLPLGAWPMHTRR